MDIFLKLIGSPTKAESVQNYQKFGDAGLIRSRKNQTYSFEKKLSVVELYLSSEISYQDLALQEGITNPSMIVNWVNCFRVAGPDALRPHKKGRRKTVEKPEKKSSTVLSTIVVPKGQNLYSYEFEWFGCIMAPVLISSLPTYSHSIILLKF